MVIVPGILPTASAYDIYGPSFTSGIVMGQNIIRTEAPKYGRFFEPMGDERSRAGFGVGASLSSLASVGLVVVAVGLVAWIGYSVYARRKAKKELEGEQP